jgi:hypothetical protein
VSKTVRRKRPARQRYSDTHGRGKTEPGSNER